MKNTIILAIIFCCCCFTVNAQIPNAGFEIWDSSAGYKVPVGWDNMNASTASSSVFTCVQRVPGYSGDAFLALTTKNVSGMGAVPAIAVSGRLDSVTHLPATGFPYTGRPQLLCGVYQYMAFASSDEGYIEILFTKWNSGTHSRDTVAHTYYPLPDMYMVWTQFFIPVTYLNSATPDSAMIVLAASGARFTPVENSYLWVDNLTFADSAALGSANLMHKSHFTISPNPANKLAYVSFTSNHATSVSVDVLDVNGRMIMSQQAEVRNGANQLPVNISQLSPGLYFIRITDDEETHVERLMVE